MKYLNKFRSEDEYWKNYEGYTNLVSSIVVNNVTYNYSHVSYEYMPISSEPILRSASSSRSLGYITVCFWEDPNHPNDETYMVTTPGRNPEVGYSAYTYNGNPYEITNVTTSPASGRDIPYVEPWCSLTINQKVNYKKYHIEEAKK